MGSDEGPNSQRYDGESARVAEAQASVEDARDNRVQRRAAVIGGGIALGVIVVSLGFFAFHGAGGVCSAALQIPTISIVVAPAAGPGTEVTAVELCSSSACSFDAAPTVSPAPTPQPVRTDAAGNPVGETDLVPGTVTPAFAQQATKNTWTIGTFPGQPTHATVLIRGAGGAVLATKTVDLKWKTQVTTCQTFHTVQPVRVTLSAG